MDTAHDARAKTKLPWLIFDGDCAFCTSSAHWLALRLHRPEGPNARLVPWQFTDLAALARRRNVPNARPCGSALTEASPAVQQPSPSGSSSEAARTGGRPSDQPARCTRISRCCLPRDREEPTTGCRVDLPPVRSLHLALTRRSQGASRSNGAKASQQIAVGAKWMYKIATVKTWNPIQNSATASRAPTPQHQDHDSRQFGSEGQPLHDVEQLGIGQQELAQPMRPPNDRPEQDRTVGPAAELQPPLRILVSADKK